MSYKFPENLVKPGEQNVIVVGMDQEKKAAFVQQLLREEIDKEDVEVMGNFGIRYMIIVQDVESGNKMMQMLLQIWYETTRRRKMTVYQFSRSDVTEDEDIMNVRICIGTEKYLPVPRAMIFVIRELAYASNLFDDFWKIQFWISERPVFNSLLDLPLGIQYPEIHGLLRGITGMSRLVVNAPALHHRQAQLIMGGKSLFYAALEPVSTKRKDARQNQLSILLNNSADEDRIMVIGTDKNDFNHMALKYKNVGGITPHPFLHNAIVEFEAGRKRIIFITPDELVDINSVTASHFINYGLLKGHNFLAFTAGKKGMELVSVPE